MIWLPKGGKWFRLYLYLARLLKKLILMTLYLFWDGSKVGLKSATQTTKLEVGELRKDIQALTGTVRQLFSNQSHFSQQGKSHNSAFAPSGHLTKLTIPGHHDDEIR